MLIVKDKNLNEIGILDNAYNVGVTRRVNEVWQASFSLPATDEKNSLCTHFNYIDIYGESGRYYGLYRIMPTQTRKDEQGDVITYSLEHVLGTLLDDILFKYHQFTNYTTRKVIEMILDKQTVKRWVLNKCDFSRMFHYSFENEAGLLAPILSIPKPFNEQYEFQFNTQTYPWELSLVSVSDNVVGEKRWGKDMISFDEVSDPTEIVNVIYPLGAGEGVNQLDITSVNNGIPYLKDDASIQEWGEKSYPWTDLRFENAESLKANAQSLLNQWKDPKISFNIQGVDLSILPEYKHEQTLLNGVIRIIVGEKEYYGRILEEHIPDLSKEWDTSYVIENRLDDIATTQADVERKISVNEAYSQGSTNIMAFSYQDNADSKIPAKIPFYIDDDVFNVNTLELTFRTDKFRTYGSTTESAGQVVKTVTSGGGGGTVQSSTTSSGGQSVQTSSTATAHRHRMFSSDGSSSPTPSQIAHFGAYADRGGSSYGLVGFVSNMTDIYTHSADGVHSHSTQLPAHTHPFSFTLQNHTHPFEINIDPHLHGVKHEIVELSETPSSVEIRVDGNSVPFDSTSGNRINLVDYMDKDGNGKIVRGRHEVTILPNERARIEADLILRVFIRSHLGGNY